MLAARNRLRRSAEFKATVRSGARFGRRNLVLYATVAAPTEPTTFGFIVAKTVGNAVKRNLVKRRLRALAALDLLSHPMGLAVVVRALPPAGDASWQEVARDYHTAFTTCLRRLGVDEATAEKGSGE